MAIRRRTFNDPEIDRLNRKGDQESELGSMARLDNDMEDADKHYARAREYWREAMQLRREKGLID